MVKKILMKDASKTFHFGMSSRRRARECNEVNNQSEKVKAASEITICASWVLECHASNKQYAIQRKATSSLYWNKAAQLQNGW